VCTDVFSLLVPKKKKTINYTPQKHHPPPPKLQLDKERAGSQAPKGRGEKKTTQNLTFDSISNCNSTNPTTRTAAAAIEQNKKLTQSTDRQTDKGKGPTSLEPKVEPFNLDPHY
jgi:hypothetical protein